MTPHANGEDLKRDFFANGFLHLRNAFSPAEMARLRETTERIFATKSPYAGDVDAGPGQFALRVNFCGRYPELQWLLVHPGLLAPLRALLGDAFLFLPEMAAHASLYGTWHKDTFSQERAGHRFHLEDDFLMIQVAIYLQDNTAAGGGLTVIPGSHMTGSDSSPDGLVPASFMARVWNFARRKLRPFLPTGLLYPGSYQVPTRIGDIVLFHFRTDHMSSIPKFWRSPNEKKFALFVACSTNNRHAHAYRAFIQSRETYHYLREGPLYPEELRRLAVAHRVTLMD